MKTLYLTRHAKSSWSSPNAQDIDRILNERGERDAPFMGNVLHKKGIQPDVFITSPAVRTQLTSKHFAKAMHYPENAIEICEEIYEATVPDLLKVVQGLNDKWASAMLFGHNTSYTDFANLYARIDNVPTCGIVAIAFDVKNWADINKKNGKLVFFEYPKLYFPKEVEMD